MHQRLAGRPKRRVHFLAAQRDVFRSLRRNLRECIRGLRRNLCQAVGGLRRRLQQAGRNLVGALAHQFGDGDGALREIVGHIGQPQLHHLDEILRQDIEFLGNGLGLEREAGIEPLGRAVDRACGRETGIFDRGRRGQADGVDCLRGFLRGLLQAFEDFAGAFSELRQHLIADAIERGRDVIGLFLQVAGDAIGRGGDLGGDLVADAGDVLIQVEMHAGDGVAHLLGLADQAVPLGAPDRRADCECGLRCRYKRVPAPRPRFGPAIPVRRRARARVPRHRPWPKPRGEWPGRRSRWIRARALPAPTAGERLPPSIATGRASRASAGSCARR